MTVNDMERIKEVAKKYFTYGYTHKLDLNVSAFLAY